LDEDDATAIRRAKEIIVLDTTKRDLAFISANYSQLCDDIDALEMRNASLKEALSIFSCAIERTMHVESQIGQDVAAKAKQIRDKNDGIAQLTAIAGVIFDCETGTDPVLKKYSARELACFKYCPITSCDVERSFSMLKALYRDNRSSFSDDNLSKHMVIHYNATPQTLPW
jgi:hypothetical protein